MKTQTGSDKSGVLESLLKDARAEANDLRRRLERQERILLSTRMIMAHELKKPATAISGYLDLVLEGGLDDSKKATENVQKARDECELLNKLNDFFLSLLRVEKQQQQLSGRMVDIECLIKDVVSHLPKEFDAIPRVQVELKSRRRCLNVNPDALRIIISNLIENALSYSPREKPVRITVDIVRDERTAAGDILVVKVADHGAGIPEHYREKIFSPFVRLPGETSRGSGLGLTLVRSLVELCNGTIRIDSDGNQGTAISLVIPGVAETESGIHR